MAILPAASYLGTMVRLVAKGRRARGGNPGLPRERLAVERSGIRVSPRQFARFLRVTDGGAQWQTLALGVEHPSRNRWGLRLREQLQAEGGLPERRDDGREQRLRLLERAERPSVRHPQEAPSPPGAPSYPGRTPPEESP
jgi:hypothetical protein